MNSILCVDKYKNLRILCERKLSLNGYRTIAASDDKEALEKVEISNRLNNNGRMYAKYEGHYSNV